MIAKVRNKSGGQASSSGRSRRLVRVPVPVIRFRIFVVEVFVLEDEISSGPSWWKFAAGTVSTGWRIKKMLVSWMNGGSLFAIRFSFFDSFVFS